MIIIKTYFVIVLAIVAIAAVGAHFFILKKSAFPIRVGQVDQTESSFDFGEVVKIKIGTNGGIIQNIERSVTITIPPLQQETEFTLSFKRSNFKVKSGIGSPMTISIYPDIDLMHSPVPINIRVTYDARYGLPVPYFVDKENRLHLVNIGALDRENHNLTMNTFHGGDYSWIYSN